MSLRFTPSLEALDARLNLSPWVPTTEPTRQITIIQDLSPPGHECLVFVLGGIPSADAAPKEWVMGTELPDANRHVRHRLFAIVDRTQMAMDGVAILTSSLPGGDTELASRNLVTTLSGLSGDLDLPDTAEQDRVGPFFEFKGSRLSVADAEDGVKYKMLFAPLILESQQTGGSDSIWTDIGAPVMTVADGRKYSTSDSTLSAPVSDDAVGDAFYGTGVYKSVDSGRSW